ncbi:hypothetical protein HFP89_05080 [Wenzhouxiangella sp. XN79A]|uniref:hypothetical protein n=1 Tax=Wenzhouxiangella sp. XN79A TaxID=2724193 RepID=UPI00144A5DCE|nr:hypothetical protein [Wenzhouxiangella sp. XN79A]NKI34534.1 hypothetical protein [Wenzhouxiangella sp. XN79A]
MNPTDIEAIEALEPAERRLVEAVEAALAAGDGEHSVLRQRLRNRVEKYRELARRARFGGAAARIDAADRQALFERLLARLDAAMAHTGPTER